MNPLLTNFIKGVEMLGTTVGPASYHPAVYWLYFALAGGAITTGFLVVRVNPSRALNRAAGFLFVPQAMWALSTGFIYLHPDTTAHFIRFSYAWAGLFVPSMWVLRCSIRYDTLSYSTLLVRAWPQWLFALVYVGTSLSPLLIPYESTWDRPLTGPLFQLNNLILSLASVAIGVVTMIDSRSLTGVRRIEAQVVGGGAVLTVGLAGIRPLLHFFTGVQVGPIIAGILGSAFIAVVLFSILAKRVFNARELFFRVGGYALAVVVTGLLHGLTMVVGRELGAPLVVYSLAAVAVALVGWSLAVRLVNHWISSDLERSTADALQRILVLGTRLQSEDWILDEAVGQLSRWATASYAEGFREVAAGFQGKSGLLPGEHPVISFLETRRWVTLDSLDRSWQTEKTHHVSRWMRSMGAQVALLIVVSPSNPRVLLVLGGRTDGRAFTYPEIGSLLRLGEALSSLIVASEAGMQGRRQGKIQAMEVLGATIGHDLKQHIAGLQLFADQLEERIHDDDFRRVYFPRVRAEIDKLIQFSRRLMALGSTTVVIKIPVSLPPLLAEVVTALEPQAKAAGVELSVELEDGLPSLKMDAGRIRQALINLGLNAIEAMSGGAQGIRPMKLSIRAERGRDYVRVEVADTGPGLPLIVVRRLFAPFVRSSKSGGNGLGLYIAWDAIVKTGGRIDYDPPAAGGARFVITLPVR